MYDFFCIKAGENGGRPPSRRSASREKLPPPPPARVTSGPHSRRPPTATSRSLISTPTLLPLSSFPIRPTPKIKEIKEKLGEALIEYTRKRGIAVNVERGNVGFRLRYHL